MDENSISLDVPQFTSASEAQRRGVGLKDRVASHFTELRQPVYRYLRSCGAPAGQSEEMVQEAFLRLYRHAQKGGQVPDVRAWIFHVAHNLLIDEIRKGALRHSDPQAVGVLETTQADPGLNPEQRLLMRERLNQLRDGIAGLTELQRHSLYLRAEGMRYREVAMVLGVSLSTVADAVRRAVRKLGSQSMVESK
jgi:RNA polymerase sigma-70 factor (ECF subfamily)